MSSIHDLFPQCTDDDLDRLIEAIQKEKKERTKFKEFMKSHKVYLLQKGMPGGYGFFLKFKGDKDKEIYVTRYPSNVRARTVDAWGRERVIELVKIHSRHRVW